MRSHRVAHPGPHGGPRPGQFARPSPCQPPRPQRMPWPTTFLALVRRRPVAPRSRWLVPAALDTLSLRQQRCGSGLPSAIHSDRWAVDAGATAGGNRRSTHHCRACASSRPCDRNKRMSGRSPGRVDGSRAGAGSTASWPGRFPEKNLPGQRSDSTAGLTETRTVRAAADLRACRARPSACGPVPAVRPGHRSRPVPLRPRRRGPIARSVRGRPGCRCHH